MTVCLQYNVDGLIRFFHPGTVLINGVTGKTRWLVGGDYEFMGQKLTAIAAWKIKEK